MRFADAGILHAVSLIIIPHIIAESFGNLIEMPVCFPQNVVVADTVGFRKRNKRQLFIRPVFLCLTLCHECHSGARRNQSRHMAVEAFGRYIRSKAIFFAEPVCDNPVLISFWQADELLPPDIFQADFPAGSVGTIR